ncbi:hypothetical protein DOTSEDRAFT_38017 [Dothistroma septosporum NZE10]|uniref:Uncharacterized protein n=1 Tax=Dothistroma septosporum (strain NZE10 / CBS 128990) TaxID=675120 RepID=N1PCI6_DOTSN|nr:hypothetical protein DOTSEDRAFT_38017 [Dothistroma septosporum NZE10]
MPPPASATTYMFVTNNNNKIHYISDVQDATDKKVEIIHAQPREMNLLEKTTGAKRIDTRIGKRTIYISAFNFSGGLMVTVMLQPDGSAYLHDEKLARAVSQKMQYFSIVQCCVLCIFRFLQLLKCPGS